MGPNEEKLKHLEFIQNVITRMNSNSFLIKGWTVTLVSALFALAAKDSNPRFVFVTYIPIPLFWGLDGFFLWQEKKYRALYDKVRQATTTDFGMDASEYSPGFCAWTGCVFSKTLLPFHGGLVAVTLVVIFCVLPHVK